MPAPTWPMPASLWAMPVLITGSTPVSATLRASMPAGVPVKSSAGRVKAALRPSVMVIIARVWARACAGVPPTNCTIAGAAAMAKPPRPAVSVIAESPMSAPASARL
jgi:hypothetical protein